MIWHYSVILLNFIGTKGAVVVLDPKDSSVLAMVSTPSYDNNLFVDGISSEDYKRLLNDLARPLYSRRHKVRIRLLRQSNLLLQ